MEGNGIKPEDNERSFGFKNSAKAHPGMPSIEVGGVKISMRDRDTRLKGSVRGNNVKFKK